MKILFKILTTTALVFSNVSSFAKEVAVDCSEAYGNKALCKKIICPEKYKSFIGSWEGDFESYDKDLKEFRPYKNFINYSEKDCIENIENKDKFIIGRKTDTYPAFQTKKGFVSKGLIITGMKQGKEENPFLRTVDVENGLVEYSKVYTNVPLNLSIWEKYYPADKNNPEMTFTVIDGQDPGYKKGHKRNVYITMKISNKEQVYWEGLLVKGSHTKK